jgi:hypothetical protein
MLLSRLVQPWKPPTCLAIQLNIMGELELSLRYTISLSIQPLHYTTILSIQNHHEHRYKHP